MTYMKSLTGLEKVHYLKKISRKNDKIKEAIELAKGKCDAGNGFVYLYRCDELDCFKIGSTTYDPFEYTITKGREYGLMLKMVAYISSPVRCCDAEWIATRNIKHKKLLHTKPCGGIAHELFKCGMHEAINILKSISSDIYIEPNPFT